VKNQLSLENLGTSQVIGADNLASSVRVMP